MEFSKPEKVILNRARTFGIVHTLWALCLIASAVSAQAHGPRDRIVHPSTCNFLARSHDREFVYEHACATALRDFDITALRGQCGDLSDGAARLELKTRLNLLELIQDASLPRSPRFHAFGRGQYILEVPCNRGAYNLSSVFFKYDERRLPSSVEMLSFPKPAGDRVTEIWSRKVSIQHRTIVEYRKYRGLGDCGYFARYSLHSRTLQPILREAIQKADCDGKARFVWSESLIKKPRGKGWVHLYNRK